MLSLKVYCENGYSVQELVAKVMDIVLSKRLIWLVYRFPGMMIENFLSS